MSRVHCHDKQRKTNLGLPDPALLARLCGSQTRVLDGAMELPGVGVQRARQVLLLGDMRCEAGLLRLHGVRRVDNVCEATDVSGCAPDGVVVRRVRNVAVPLRRRQDICRIGSRRMAGIVDGMRVGLRVGMRTRRRGGLTEDSCRV